MIMRRPRQGNNPSAWRDLQKNPACRWSSLCISRPLRMPLPMCAQHDRRETCAGLLADSDVAACRLRAPETCWKVGYFCMGQRSWSVATHHWRAAAHRSVRGSQEPRLEIGRFGLCICTPCAETLTERRFDVCIGHARDKNTPCHADLHRPGLAPCSPM